MGTSLFNQLMRKVGSDSEDHRRNMDTPPLSIRAHTLFGHTVFGDSGISTREGIKLSQQHIKLLQYSVFLASLSVPWFRGATRPS